MSKYRSNEIKNYSRMFAALSNPNRATIFLRLAECCCGDNESCNHDEMRACVGDLGKDLGLALSTISHHIKELHNAGLIKMERRGRTVRCCVDPEKVRLLRDFFASAARGNPPVRKLPTKRI